MQSDFSWMNSKEIIWWDDPPYWKNVDAVQSIVSNGGLTRSMQIPNARMRYTR